MRPIPGSTETIVPDLPEGKGAFLQDTLWTSLFARNTLPACYGPANRYPTPPAELTSVATGLGTEGVRGVSF